MLPTDTLNKAVNVLNEGGVILYPTDTIWGIGCDPFNEDAFHKVFQIKERPGSQPLILLVDSISMLKKYTAHIHPRVETLLAYHDRPLTIVYPKAMNLPDYVCGKDGSVAIRVVKQGTCHKLINLFGKPVTSTSSNKHGKPAPKNFGEISSDILSNVDMVLLGHQEESDTESEPSVIASYNDRGELEFIRE